MRLDFMAHSLREYASAARQSKNLTLHCGLARRLYCSISQIVAAFTHSKSRAGAMRTYSLYLEVDQDREAWPPEFPIGEGAELPLVFAPHKGILCFCSLVAQHHLQGVTVKYKLHP